MAHYSFMSAEYRRSKQASIDDCLLECGAAVDDLAAFKVTVFCWMNNYSVDELSFGAEYLNDEEWY